MSLDIKAVYQALDALDCAVTRGWPQALIPLPAIAISGCTDSLDEEGERRFAVDLCLRAASPEWADALAAQAQAALMPLGLLRTQSKDGADKTSDSFTKTLRYEIKEAAPDAADTRLALTLGGRAWPAQIISRTCRRRLHDITRLTDTGQRLLPAGEEYSRLKLRLPGSALTAAQAQYDAGEALPLLGRNALIEGLTLNEGRLELSLCHSL